jgi:hypothetical protein
MAWQDFKLIGFAPDLSITTTGNIVTCDHWYPTIKGFRQGPWIRSDSTIGGTSGAIDTQSLGSAVVSKTDGTQRIFVGTAAKLWEYDGNATITDRSDTAYSATSTNSWSFTQFGDVTLAANLGNTLRQINAGGTFSNVGAAPVPKASIIVTCGPTSAPFVMAFDTDNGTNAYRDGWINSGIADATSGVAWTIGTNGCQSGRLIDDLPGPITAAVPFGDGVIAFKPAGMYVGSYATELADGWSWKRIARGVGCIGKNAVINVNDIVYFADKNGLWIFDGSYPKPMPGSISDFWANGINISDTVTQASSRHFVKLVWDSTRHIIWFWVPSTTSNNYHVAATSCAFNVISQLWGQRLGLADAAVSTLPGEVISSGYYVSQSKKLGSIQYAANGTNPPAANMSLWVIGDGVNSVSLSGIRPTYAYGPTSGAGTSALVYAGDNVRDDTGAVNIGSTTFVVRGAKRAFDGNSAGPYLWPILTYAAGTIVEISAASMKMNLAPQGKN